MPSNPHQPREDDAVLGGDSQPPTNAVVLGGLEGVKRRFASSVEAQRISALNDALNYGSSGLDLVIQALHDKSGNVKLAAYSLLLTKTETKAKIALQEFNPYQFFECVRTIMAHRGGVNSVAISPDGKTIVSGGSDTTIKVWDIVTGECQRTLQLLHSNEFSGLNTNSVRSVAITPDGKTIISKNMQEPSIIQLWDLMTGECLHTLEGHSGVIAPDGETIISIGSRYNTINVWDILTGECLHTLQVDSNVVVPVAITPDGKTLVSAYYTFKSCDKAIKAWDIPTGECLGTLTLPWPLSSNINCVAIAPDGKTIVSPSGDTIFMWDIVTGESLGTLKGHSRHDCRVAISPDGKTIVSRSHDNTIKVWDILTRECQRTLQGHLYSVTSVAISPDGKTIVSGSGDNTIKVWGIG